jgi:hypothetical protein
MATATITMDTDLKKSIAGCREQLIEAEQQLRDVDLQIADESDKLAELQAHRAGECEQLAFGRRADPAKFDSRIRSTEDKLHGLATVKRTRERAIVDLKADLNTLLSEQSRQEQAVQIEAETKETQELIARTRSALEQREQSERNILDGITRLRGRKYLAESNRRTAADAAQILSRRYNGMNP